MKNLSLLSRVFMFGLFLSALSLLGSYSLSPAYAATSTSATSTTQLASLERQITTITRTSNNLISSIKSLGTIRARLIKSISTLSDGSPTRARLAKQLEATEKRILSQYKQLLVYRAQIADIQKKIAQIKSPPVVTSTGVTVPGSSSNTSSQGGGSSG